MTHRWMSARVKKGTNITGKADRSASVLSVTNKGKQLWASISREGLEKSNIRKDTT